MSEEKTKTPSYPDMPQLEIDDVVRVLMGVAPEGEEIVIYEEDEKD